MKTILPFLKHRQTFTSFLLVALLACTGCGDGAMHVEDVVVDDSLMATYHAMAVPVKTTALSDSIDCYIDYSYGMGEGMKATADINSKLQDFLRGRKTTYYKVGASVVPPAVDITTPAGNLLNLANYNDPGSRLKVAIDSITQHKNRTSVFITDFERVEDVSKKQTFTGAKASHPIDVTAWAQNEFKDWLMTGNRLDIFAKQYSKPDVWFGKSNQRFDNWIYTLVFTPDAVFRNQKSYNSSVLFFMEQEYASADTSNSKHFSYDAGRFTVAHGKNNVTGDANENLIVQSLQTNPKTNAYEFYEFNSGDLLAFNTNETQNDKRIINKLKITADSIAFSQVDFDIKVYNVSTSMTDYYTSLHQEAPEVVTDAASGKTDTVAHKPVVYQFEEGEPVSNLFGFLYNPKTHEAGIQLQDDFSGVPETGIYRIDFVVKSVKLADFSEATKVLRLNYANNYSIPSLGESVRLAMHDVSVAIVQKVIYSIYIKINS